jgi:hypothetical protein
MFNNFFFENREIYEIMWKNIVERDRLQMTVWCMHIACWMRKTTSTHLEFIILFDCPLQQWLHECVLGLHYTYIACLLFVSTPAMGTVVARGVRPLLLLEVAF